MQQWKSLSCVLLFETPWAIQSWNSPIQNTGVGSLSLLQGIFPTQRSNPSLLHYKWILYQLSHKGSSRILEWVPYPFSRGSSWPRDWTGVSSIADRLFTNWAIREGYVRKWSTLNLRNQLHLREGKINTVREALIVFVKSYFLSRLVITFIIFFCACLKYFIL